MLTYTPKNQTSIIYISHNTTSVPKCQRWQHKGCDVSAPSGGGWEEKKQRAEVDRPSAIRSWGMTGRKLTISGWAVPVLGVDDRQLLPAYERRACERRGGRDQTKEEGGMNLAPETGKGMWWWWWGISGLAGTKANKEWWKTHKFWSLQCKRGVLKSFSTNKRKGGGGRYIPVSSLSSLRCCELIRVFVSTRSSVHVYLHLYYVNVHVSNIRLIPVF